jgi:hypothetical protein
MRRIGVVMGLAASDPGGEFEVGALKRGLQALGWIEGRNLQIKFTGLGERACGTTVRSHCWSFYSGGGGAPQGDAQDPNRFRSRR